MKNKPDILIFLSDQHTPFYTQPWGGPAKADTLSYLCRHGTTFSNAYTSCPLCVPSRMSMLSGLLPSRTGILTNSASLPDTIPTFLHCLVSSGYETVLIGRMHFIGQNQRHGFTKRLGGDITPVGYFRPETQLKKERGIFCDAFEVPGSIQFCGGGNSPVLAYDRHIIETAANYLRQDHKKPQCIVVGTYAPHFPYVAPPKLYFKYKEIIKLPEQFYDSSVYNPLLERRRIRISEEHQLAVLSAYCGMIEFMDQQIQKVYHLFLEFTKRRNTKHLFCYLSDHGDQAGEKNFYGKFTFFEKSVKIPLIFEGDGIPENIRIQTPVSIMDLGPTLCQYSGADFPLKTDGKSLMPLIAGSDRIYNSNRYIFSEIIERDHHRDCLGRLCVYQQYKYITYHHYENDDMLFDLSEDPGERHNIIGQHPDIVRKCQNMLSSLPSAEITEQKHEYLASIYNLFADYEHACDISDDERWKDIPEDARRSPCT